VASNAIWSKTAPILLFFRPMLCQGMFDRYGDRFYTDVLHP
jgi:hypothetical protein